MTFCPENVGGYAEGFHGYNRTLKKEKIAIKYYFFGGCGFPLAAGGVSVEGGLSF